MNQNSKIGKSYLPNFLGAINRNKEANYKESKKDPVKVMLNIIRNQHSQYKKEILNWKMAKDEARNLVSPRRVLLNELYMDIEEDAIISGLVYNNRILRISNKKFKIIDFNTKEENKDLTDLLNRSWFKKFVKRAMESIFHGHSLIYFSEFIPQKKEFKDIEIVPREHVVPDFKAWTNHVYGNDYNYYEQNPYRNYLIGVGEKNDLGIFNKCAPYWILKKHSWSNWDEFEEIFGIPVRYAKTASSDKNVLNSIENWLKAMGSAAYGVFPMDTELDIKESSNTDAFEVFDRKRKAANEELEVLIMGLKNITQENGTYGKQEIISRDMDQVTEDDLTFIYHLINDELLPLLIRNGYPFTENDVFVWDDSKFDPEGKLKLFEGAKRLGFKLDKDEVSNDLGLKLEEMELEETETEVPAAKKNTPAKQLLKLNNKLNELYFNS